jgi:hypothetical protein
MESLKCNSQFTHRVDGVFERIFNACIKAGSS